MENSQSPSDYKDYFNNKFITIFKELVFYLIDILPDCSSKIDLLKISQLLDKLNYDKIISKIATNTKLIEVLTYFK